MTAAESPFGAGPIVLGGLPIPASIVTLWGPLVGGILLSLYLVYRAALPKPFPEIPYNKESVNRILGDLPLLPKTPNHRAFFMEQNIKHNSPIVQVFLRPLSKPFVVVSDFQIQMDVCLRRTKDFDRSVLNHQTFVGVIPNHHITMQTRDPRFKGNKELVRDLMTPAFLNDVSAPEIYNKVISMVKLWTVKTSLAAGRPFQADEDIYEAALDIILAAAFAQGEDSSILSRQLNYLRSRASDVPDVTPATAGIEVRFPHVELPDELLAATAITDSLGIPMKSPTPVFSHWLWRQGKKARKAFELRDGMLRREIKASVERLNQQETKMRRCALDDMMMREMATAKKQGREPVFDSGTIRDELFGYIVGGHDTTSTTFSWCVKYLADNFGAQTKLRAALVAALPVAASEKRQPSITELTRTSIPYLDAVVEETLRHSFTLPITNREAVRDTTLLGYAIPKGTSVIFTTNGPSFFLPSLSISQERRHAESANGDAAKKDRYGAWAAADVSEFLPERWLRRPQGTDEEKLAATDPDGMVFDATSGPQGAFGLGPRQCFGKRLAYLEMRVLLAMLVWNFEFQKVPEAYSSYEPIEKMTTHPKVCYVKLRTLVGVEE